MAGGYLRMDKRRGKAKQPEPPPLSKDEFKAKRKAEQKAKRQTAAKAKAAALLAKRKAMSKAEAPRLTAEARFWRGQTVPTWEPSIYRGVRHSEVQGGLPGLGKKR